MKTFVEFLAERDPLLFREYAELSLGEAGPGWFRGVLPYGAALVAGALMGNTAEAGKKKTTPPKDPTAQVQPANPAVKPAPGGINKADPKAATAKTPDAPPAASGLNAGNLKTYLEYFSKLRIKVTKYNDERTGKHISTDIKADLGDDWYSVGPMSGSYAMKALNAARMGVDAKRVTGQDMLQAIEVIGQSLPGAYERLGDTMIRQMKDNILYGLLGEADMAALTPQQAAKILAHLTKPPENSQMYMSNAAEIYSNLQQKAQGGRTGGRMK